MSSHVDSVRNEVRALLHRKGMRATASRLAVLVALHEHQGPMTHEQVMAVLPDGVHDKASVWRILAHLAEEGLLRRMDLGDRTWRYELDDACRSVADGHPHFLCEACGEVSCLPPLVLRSQDGTVPEALRGAEFRVRVMGLCPDCVA